MVIERRFESYLAHINERALQSFQSFGMRTAAETQNFQIPLGARNETVESDGAVRAQSTSESLWLTRELASDVVLRASVNQALQRLHCRQRQSASAL